MKFLNDRNFLAAACEHFLGRDVDDIKDTILQTLEGHLRAILGTLSVESIYRVCYYCIIIFAWLKSLKVGTIGQPPF